MYRLLDNLGEDLRKGSLHSLKHISPKAIKLLLEKDRIAVWQSPPLEVLPGWSRKAKAFAKVGITTVSDLVEADFQTLLKKMEISETALRRCLEEVGQWIK